MILLKSFGDVFKNTDNSLMELVKLREKLLEIVNSIYDKLNGKVACNSEKFLEYCKNGEVVTKKEKLGEEFSTDKIVTDFKQISMKDSLSSFKDTNDTRLLNLIQTFEEKEGKEFNVFDKDDFYKLTKLFFDSLKIDYLEIINLADEIKKSNVMKVNDNNKNSFTIRKRFFCQKRIYFIN